MKTTIISITVNILLIIAVVLSTLYYRSKIDILEYANNKLTKDVQRNSWKIRDLDRYRDYKFLRLFQGNCNTKDRVNHTNYYSDVWQVYVKPTE